MCLSAEAFALFLNLISPDLIESQPGRITINATARTAVWTAHGAHWCVDGGETRLELTKVEQT